MHVIREETMFVQTFSEKIDGNGRALDCVELYNTVAVVTKNSACAAQNVPVQSWVNNQMRGDCGDRVLTII